MKEQKHALYLSLQLRHWSAQPNVAAEDHQTVQLNRMGMTSWFAQFLHLSEVVLKHQLEELEEGRNCQTAVGVWFAEMKEFLHLYGLKNSVSKLPSWHHGNLPLPAWIKLALLRLILKHDLRLTGDMTKNITVKDQGHASLQLSVVQGGYTSMMVTSSGYCWAMRNDYMQMIPRHFIIFDQNACQFSCIKVSKHARDSLHNVDRRRMEVRTYHGRAGDRVKVFFCDQRSEQTHHR